MYVGKGNALGLRCIARRVIKTRTSSFRSVYLLRKSQACTIVVVQKKAECVYLWGDSYQRNSTMSIQMYVCFSFYSIYIYIYGTRNIQPLDIQLWISCWASRFLAVPQYAQTCTSVSKNKYYLPEQPQPSPFPALVHTHCFELNATNDDCRISHE